MLEPSESIVFSYGKKKSKNERRGELNSTHPTGSPELPLFVLSGYIKEQEMQKEPKSHGAVYEVDAETMKAFDIASVRARMEARKEAQSPAWEAISRIAGREIDFEVDDLVALEARAQAEFNRTRAKKREDSCKRQLSEMYTAAPKVASDQGD